MSKGKGFSYSLSVGLRLGAELVIAILIGSVMGYALDDYFNTSPWMLVVGMLFGVATGCLNVYRCAQKIEDNGFNDEPDL